MIISKKYARSLVNNGQAQVVGTVWDNGIEYVCINRLDLQRTDHYPR